MARGESGRIVLEVETDLKKELYAELARQQLTLKAWFIDMATRYIAEQRQPTLFPLGLATSSVRPQDGEKP